MGRRQVYIVDYAYGFNARTCEVDYVCRLRSEAALRALKKRPEAHIVLGAGMKEVTGDCGALADMMRAYLIEKGVPPHRIYSNPHGSDTLSETEAAMDVVRRHGGGRVICTTSAFHAPRVALIWLVRFGRLPYIYTTKRRARRMEIVHEFWKVPRDVARALLHLVGITLPFERHIVRKK